MHRLSWSKRTRALFILQWRWRAWRRKPWEWWKEQIFRKRKPMEKKGTKDVLVICGENKKEGGETCPIRVNTYIMSHSIPHRCEFPRTLLCSIFLSDPHCSRSFAVCLLSLQWQDFREKTLLSRTVGTASWVVLSHRMYTPTFSYMQPGYPQMSDLF